MTLFERVFGGNDYNYERTVAAVNEAIAANGEVSASVNVSAQSGNIIEAKADGIYAGVEWQTLA